MKLKGAKVFLYLFFIASITASCNNSKLIELNSQQKISITPPPSPTSTKKPIQNPIYQPSKTATFSLKRLLTATPFPINFSDLEKAQEILINVFNYWAKEDSDQVLVLLDAPENYEYFDWLRIGNYDIPEENLSELLKITCARQRRCMPIREIIQASQISDTEFIFVIQFALEDGSLYFLDPCCGANATDQPPISEFEYKVIKKENSFIVIESLFLIP